MLSEEFIDLGGGGALVVRSDILKIVFGRSFMIVLMSEGDVSFV